ncbi:MAG: GNAT family N-acetyltransferase [Lachnospiraceae bacterium]|nr:GNAT family N-acetyltransferase [Lachnospiraceae bacterium]
MKRILRPLRDEEWVDAISLVWRVFLNNNAEECTKYGMEKFFAFLNDDILYKMYRMGNYRVFACFISNILVGIISARNTNHISLLFIEDEYQHQHIGTALINYLSEYLRKYESQTFITVDASPSALSFYENLGFTVEGHEETRQGIRYIPMRLSL